MLANRLARSLATRSAATRLSSVSAVSAYRMQQRLYSSQFQLNENQRNDEKTKQKSFKWLIILGSLALGTTLIARNTQGGGGGRQPQESLESVVESKKKTDEGKDDFTGISVIFVLGGPGAGKGTQCAKLVKEHNFVHLSAGDLLREEQNREGSQYGQMIADYIRQGLIVPQEVTIGLLKRNIKENVAKGKTRFLIDGFPRKMDQAITFEQQVCKSDFTLFFECPEEVMMKRLMDRGKTSGRTDDNAESIKKRFRVFVETSMPVVDYFSKQDRVVRLHCDKKPDEVFATVEKALKERNVV